MQHLLQFGLSNAVAAAVLAVLAAVATRVWRNPYFAYALWLVVLLRLVAPPLLPVGVPVPEWLAGNSREPLPAVSEPEKNVPPPVDVSAFVARSTGEPKPSPVAPDRTARMAKPSTAQFAGRESNTVAQAPLREDHGDPEGAPPRDSLGLSKGVPEEASKPSTSRWPSIANRLAAAWLTGTLCYLLLTTLRVRTFARVLRRARREVPAGVAAEAAEVAAAVGLRRAPRLAFAEAALPPMVWPGWRSVVLLPKALFTSLGAAERRLLLWHEFVHLRRRDHLVRWFEVGVVGLYWWNPVAWWAVARLQQAEEDCCDAAILVAHPHESARYGETLVSVAQFLSAGTLPTPSLSLGVARNHHIKRRLTMILHGPRWPELSKSRLAAFSLLGAALVAVTWTAAKAQPASATPAATGVSPTSSTQPDDEGEDWVPVPTVNEIYEVLVKGNVQIPTADILEKVHIHAGRQVPQSQIEEGLYALMQTGQFFSVIPKYRHTAKQSTVTLVVAERPLMKTVSYLGAREFDTKSLAAVTQLEVGRPYYVSDNKAAVRRLEDFYSNQGFPDATVELIQGDKPEDRDVVFRIHEGAGKKIVWTSFVGNNAVSDERLAKVLKSSPVYVFSKGRLEPSNVIGDVAALRKYYADLGFFDATVTPKIEYGQNRGRVSLKYAVHEGEPYRIRHFSMTGNIRSKSDVVLKTIKTREGQFYDASQIREDLEKFKQAYEALEHTHLNVELVPSFPKEPAVIDLVLRVEQTQNERGSSPVSMPAPRPTTEAAPAAGPALAANGDTNNGAALLVAQAAPVPQAQSVPLSKMEPMQPAPGDDELRKLQKERYNAALRELKLNEYQFDIGTTRVSAVCQATRKFVEAWQALAQRPADELRAVDWYVGYTNRLWNGAHARLIAGGVTGFTAVDEAEARAARFEAQIESMKLRQSLEAKTGGAVREQILHDLQQQPTVATARSTASASRKRIFRNSYERTDSGDPPPVQSGLFPPNLMPMSIAPSDDEERKLHKQQYNAAAEEMDIYRKEWQAGKLDLAVQIENVLAAAGKMRDAELPLCSDAEARLATLGKYLDLTRSLEQVALGWVKHGVATANAPREAVRMHEASLEAELQISRIRRELAQNNQRNQPSSPPQQTPRLALPRLLAAGPVPIAIDPNDELRVKLLKEQYNALQSLKGVNKSGEPSAALTVSELLKTARQMLAAQVALARPRDLVWVYEGYVEVMKYFESLVPTLPPGATLPAPVADQMEAIREARLEAEQKLAEATQGALNKRERRTAGTPGASATEQPGATRAATKSEPAAYNGSPVPQPALLTRLPLEPEAHDDERLKLLKERYNAALRLLQASYKRHAVDMMTAATNVLAAARRVLAADLALMSDPKFGKPAGQSPVDARQRYFELMKYLEREAEARFQARMAGQDEVEAAHEARLDAELELLEEKSGKAAPTNSQTPRTWITR